MRPLCDIVDIMSMGDEAGWACLCSEAFGSISIASFTFNRGIALSQRIS